MNNNHSEEINKALVKFENQEGQDFLIQILKMVLVRTPKDINDINNAFAKKDFGLLKEKAHLLAGTLSSFNFSQGVLFANDLFKSCENKIYDNIHRDKKKLIYYLDTVLYIITTNYELE